jgi:hypothetical protein
MEYNPKHTKKLEPSIEMASCANRRCSNLFPERPNKIYCCSECRKMENHAKCKDKLLTEEPIKERHCFSDESFNAIYSMPNNFTPPLVFDWNKPERYTKGKIECIEAIKSAVTGKRPEEAIMVGNIIKYLWRYESKGGLEDIEKAEVYLKFLKEEVISNKKE